MARKPMSNSVAQNMLTYGVGGINIDECRVEYKNETDSRIGTNAVNTSKCGFWQKDKNNGTTQMYKDNGRFPANIITDGSKEVGVGMGDNLRYFYSAKASKKDRDSGLDGFSETQRTDGCIRSNSETARKFGANSGVAKNIHPTVKPCELMQYLVRLVSPKGSTILDCFMGSGSTGKAVMYENAERNANYKFVGVEMTPEYLPIAKARIVSVKDAPLQMKFDL